MFILLFTVIAAGLTVVGYLFWFLNTKKCACCKKRFSEAKLHFYQQSETGSVFVCLTCYNEGLVEAWLGDAETKVDAEILSDEETEEPKRKSFRKSNPKYQFFYETEEEWYKEYCDNPDSDLRGHAYPIVSRAFEAGRKMKS